MVFGKHPLGTDSSWFPHTFGYEYCQPKIKSVFYSCFLLDVPPPTSHLIPPRTMMSIKKATRHNSWDHHQGVVESSPLDRGQISDLLFDISVPEPWMLTRFSRRDQRWATDVDIFHWNIIVTHGWINVAHQPVRQSVSHHTTAPHPPRASNNNNNNYKTTSSKGSVRR